MEYRTVLAELLVKKTAPVGERPALSATELDDIGRFLANPAASLTQQTIALALLLAAPLSAVEQAFIDGLRQQPQGRLPEALRGFFDPFTPDTFQLLVNQVLLRRPLSAQQAQQAIQLLPQQPEHLQAAFLWAFRLKGVQKDETEAFFVELKAQVQPYQTGLGHLIDLADHHLGSNTHPMLNLFVAAVLAATGYPCLVHGASNPGTNLSHAAILHAAGKRTDLSIEEAAARLQNDEIGWAYIDQAAFLPQWQPLVGLRAEHCLHSLLDPIEKLLQPIVAKKNYLLVNYQEQDPLLLAHLVAVHADLEKALLIPGMGGSCMLNPASKAECYMVDKQQHTEWPISGQALGFSENFGQIANLTAEEALTLGQLVLDAENSPLRNFIEFQCVSALHYFFGISPREAHYEVRQAIDSGMALRCWQNY